MIGGNHFGRLLLALIIFLSCLGATGMRLAGAPYIFHDLGTLADTESYAYGINNNGQVVGCSHAASDSTDAFIYSYPFGPCRIWVPWEALRASLWAPTIAVWQ